MKRKETRLVMVGNVPVGGQSPITVQTMTNTKTSDVETTLKQIRRVVKVGADLVRVSVPDEESASALKLLSKKASVPLIADIHFNYKLAISSVLNGAAKIRINPGTIGSQKFVKEIIAVCKESKAPIRIGLNAASLPRKYRKTNHVEALVEAAKYWISFFEDNEFFDIVISAKSSSVLETVEVYERISELFNYPLHIGVTESGTLFSGTIRSSSALAILLSKGIGDTLRISLSADPVYEVRAGIELLKSLGLRQGPIVISCPTCARTKVNVEKMANKVEKMLSSIKIPVKVAIMGCEVNGPGEAKDADLGLAGTSRGVMVFKKGEPIGIFSEEEAYSQLLKLIEGLKEEQ